MSVVRDNPVQFAVVREDPLTEAALLDPGASRALLIASGGCTALSLASLRPEVELTLVDPNRAQLELIERKVAALARFAPATFNVGDPSPAGLTACGNFESLFRGLRDFLQDLVLPEAGWRALLRGEVALARALDCPYWPAAFRIFFADALLHAMFGPAATQNAAPGTYPAHFQAALERGLRAPDRADNYFLHHILLGCYLEHALPPYLSLRPTAPRFTLVHGHVHDARDLGRFDLISLSNITDWMNAEELARLATALENLRPGARVLFRQLNSTTDLTRVFGRSLAFDVAAGRRLLAADRSLFYSAIHVATRR